MRNDLTDLTDPTDDSLSPNGRNVVRLTDEVRFNSDATELIRTSELDMADSGAPSDIDAVLTTPSWAIR